MRNILATLQLRIIVIVALLRLKYVRVLITPLLVFATLMSFFSVKGHLEDKSDWVDSAKMVTGVITGAEMKTSTSRRTGGGTDITYICQPLVAYELSEVAQLAPSLSWLSFPSDRALDDACADDRLGEKVELWIVGEGTGFRRFLEEKPEPGDQIKSLILSVFSLLCFGGLLWLIWRKKELHETNGWK